jgi:hypothetical protein
LLACAGRRRKRRERVCTGRGVEEGGKNECANVQRRSERAGESIAGGVRRREEKRREEKRREENEGGSITFFTRREGGDFGNRTPLID